MMSIARPAIVLFLLFTLITGVAYPLAIAAIAQIAFPAQANGSILRRDGEALGSALIGQSFADPKYFWSRLSATSPFPYNAGASAASNLGPTNLPLLETFRARLKALKDADPGNTHDVLVDLVTTSGSGLDRHIRPAAAAYQLERVARARRIDPKAVEKLVAQHTEDRALGVLVEPRVNVLAVNLALDAVR